MAESSLSLAQKIGLEKAVVVHLITTKTHYFYVAIPGSHITQFMSDLQTRSIDVAHYGGIILQSGRGKPSDQIKRYMEKEYGCKSDTGLYLLDQ